MEHIRIDEKLICHIPESLKKIPQFNHNVQTYTIDCPRYTQNGEDMLEMVPFILVEKKGEEPVPVECTAPVLNSEDENRIQFDWTITREVTDIVGKLAFVICVRKSDEEENLENAWHTYRNEDIEIERGIT